MNKATHELNQRIRARFPIIAIMSHEENRVMSSIKEVAKKHSRRLAVWSYTTGMTNIPGRDQDSTRDIAPALEACLSYNKEDPTIFVLKDVHPFFNDPMIIRFLRDISADFEGCKHTLILLSPDFTIPGDLEKSIVIMDWPLPNAVELSSVLSMCERDLPQNMININGDREEIVKAMSGLSEFEARNALAAAVIENSGLDQAVIPYIIKEKKQVIRKSGVLTYYEADTTMGSVGGLNNLKRYAAEKLDAFSDEAASFGLDAPKGVLMVGIPGTGKSLSVKAIAGNRLPLLRMDIGALMGSLVGQSEANIRSALKVAEAVSPCVLWIDEIEKGMSGSGDLDGGTSKRVFGTFLTWMQDNKSPVYVCATANDVRSVPPELLRRFDDIFWVDLPCFDDRVDIFRVHLSKRGHLTDEIEASLPAIANMAWGYTGAEIEKIVKRALEHAWHERRELIPQDLADAVDHIVPISATMKEKINQLRDWAKDVKYAGAPLEEKPVAERKSRFSDL